MELPPDSRENIFLTSKDPEFVNAGGWFYTLRRFITLYNSGTLDPVYLPEDWICPLTCLCGNPRVSNEVIDMGCYEVLQTGMNDFIRKDISSVNIFPNPINAQATIEFYLENEMPVQVSITDIHGRVVYAAEKSVFKAGRNQLTFGTGNMAAGVYLCRLKKGNETLYRKIVKLN